MKLFVAYWEEDYNNQTLLVRKLSRMSDSDEHFVVYDLTGREEIITSNRVVQVIPDVGQFESLEEAADVIEVSLALNPETNMMRDLIETEPCPPGTVKKEHLCVEDPQQSISPLPIRVTSQTPDEK